MKHNRTWVELNQEALRGNVKALRSLLPKKVALLAMVKANAYGHGLVEAASILDNEVDWFGVDALHEGAMVREHSTKPVMITGALEIEFAEEVVLRGFHQVVSDVTSIEALNKSAKKLDALANIHIKVDTGMSRQGVRLDGLPELFKIATTLSNINVSGIATHFANADDIDDDATSKQLKLFNIALGAIRQYGFQDIIRHSANSAAILTRPDAHFDLVRAGIVIYGVMPSLEIQINMEQNFEPALSWRTRIVQLKDVPEGERIGYGLTKRLNCDSTIAILPVGYSDGYDRRLSNNADVLLRGKRARVLGNVSMDMITVDVTDIPDIEKGDTATLIGVDGEDNISVQEIAKNMDTIPYEVLARINPSILRVPV